MSVLDIKNYFKTYDSKYLYNLLIYKDKHGCQHPLEQKAVNCLIVSVLANLYLHYYLPEDYSCYNKL